MNHTFSPPVKAGLPWKNLSTRSRRSEKKPFLVILMWECGRFVSLPGWLMNPDMKRYWMKCWPSSGVPSHDNFLSGSLILYSFLHNGPAKAKRMQRIIQDGCHPGSYEFKPLKVRMVKKYVFYSKTSVLPCKLLHWPSILPCLPSFLPLSVECLP